MGCGATAARMHISGGIAARCAAYVAGGEIMMVSSGHMGVPVADAAARAGVEYIVR